MYQTCYAEIQWGLQLQHCKNITNKHSAQTPHLCNGRPSVFNPQGSPRSNRSKSLETPPTARPSSFVAGWISRVSPPKKVDYTWELARLDLFTCVVLSFYTTQAAVLSCNRLTFVPKSRESHWRIPCAAQEQQIPLAAMLRRKVPNPSDPFLNNNDNDLNG